MSPTRSEGRRPARKRSQTHLDGRQRQKRSGRSYASISLSRLALPSLGAQRSTALGAIAALVLLLVTILVWPLYRVAEVQVVGNQATATQSIENAVSYARGISIFLIRSAGIEQSVRSLTGVDKVDVHAVLPNRLVINVVDTRPEVVWLAGGATFWVDKKGTVNETVAARPEQAIVINDLSGRTYATGDSVDPAAVQTALQLKVMMPSEIQGFEFFRDYELILVSTQKWRAVFSTRDDLSAQVEALRQAASRVRAAAMFDVRVASMVTYR
jgi:hypothetical protein